MSNATVEMSPNHVRRYAMRNKILIALLLGQFVGLLGWVDAIYIPFVLAGPPIVGAIAAARGIPVAPVMVLWASAGLNMLWVDWLVNREDVVFHAVLAVVMAVLAAFGWGVVALVNRFRGTAPA